VGLRADGLSPFATPPRPRTPPAPPGLPQRAPLSPLLYVTVGGGAERARVEGRRGTKERDVPPRQLGAVSALVFCPRPSRHPSTRTHPHRTPSLDGPGNKLSIASDGTVSEAGLAPPISHLLSLTHRLPADCNCHRARHGSCDRRGHAHARVRGASRRAPSRQIQQTSEPCGGGGRGAARH
jgi:hypothetical protein